MNIVDEIEKENMKEKAPQCKVGDLVDVHVKTVEGEKERIQVFNGTVISKKGSGNRITITVRRVVQGEGVERVFPIHSPNIVKIVVKKSHKIRRAKLYYLRDRKGKSARLKEIRKRVKKTSKSDQTVPVVADEEAVEAEATPAEATKTKKTAKKTEKTAKAEKAPKAKAKAKAKKKDEKPSTES
ncbi:MAG: 50S ribosomal protein L19 [Candidatus Scalindua sp.]|nr:50S ribosomal protein L19 [Candidatus Scalindua sp.]